jgi:hypothetical protein
MKTFILLLLLSLPALAKNEYLNGLFQVDSSQSSITLLDEDQDTSGFLDIREQFRDSILKVESSDTFFESEEIIGSPEDFVVRGQFTHNGIKRLVQLKGKSFSVANKVAIKLHNETIMIRIIASRPTSDTTSLQKQVEKIIQ